MLLRSVVPSCSCSLAFARSAAWCLPAAGKASPTGEDGFYISRSGSSLGVADGVGGWTEKGVDPSKFTRTLMHHALERAETLTAVEAEHQREEREEQKEILAEEEAAAILAATEAELDGEVGGKKKAAASAAAKKKGKTTATASPSRSKSPPPGASHGSSSSSSSTSEKMTGDASDHSAHHHHHHHHHINASPRHFTSHSVMQYAFEKVMEQELPGSCTALFATLESDAPVAAPTNYARPKRSDPPTGPFAMLNIANIGDCGIAIVRADAGIIFINQEQLRAFNYPFQLGPEAESPSDGTVFDYCLAQHDVVVMGTDGLFVNVDREELLDVVNKQWKADTGSRKIDCNAVAKALGRLARKNYLKTDDITLVVAQVDQVRNLPASDGVPEGKSLPLELPSYRLIEEYYEQYPPKP